MRIFPAMLLAAGLLAGLLACESKEAGHSADPTQSLLEKGQEAFKQGNYDQALQAYQKALKQEPRSAVILNLMGMAYRFKHNQLRSPDLKEKEIAAFKQAIEMDAKFIPALVNLGSTYYFSDKKKEAAEQFKKVLEIMPQHPEAEQLKKMIAEAEEGAEKTTE
jgi:cytochrome c-type biogenesis protein CcmH/NrfG